jgi:P27 family predicted phage terminase small subunit
VLLRLRGSRAANKRKREPVLPEGVPTCPSWLDGEAKAEWKRIVPSLESAGVLARVDRGILAGYCQGWSDYHRAAKAVQREGEIFTTPKGYVAKNPWVTIKNEAWTRCFKAAAVLGLSPSARASLHAEPRKAVSGKDRFFNSG